MALAALPSRPDSFVGRERELEQLGALLASARLLTLTGPGGVGKTRLAIQTAHTLKPAFAGDALFVDLTSLHDPRDVLPRVAQAFGVADQERDQLLPRLYAELETRRVLLVLDNFEQVLAAAGDVAALLEAAPSLVVLATSRAPLRIPGEQEYAVPPLDAPPPDQAPGVEQLLRYPAARLFLLRAQQVRPGFVFSDDNAPTVAAICRRLDGLPLAIELAAARMRTLPPQQLLERLDQRLELLTRGAGGLHDRHKTLRAAISWSHDLLGEPARRLFRRLAIFVGGATLEAIETICEDSSLQDSDPELLLNLLEELVEQSMVQLHETPGPEPRFLMLQTIGEYAAEQLAASGEQGLVRERHTRYYLALAEQAEPHLFRQDLRSWMRRLEAEYENLRAVIEWSLASDGGVTAQRIVGAIWRFLWLHGHLHDGRRWLERALADDAHLPPTHRTEAEREALRRRARAWWAAGYLTWVQVDYPAAEAAHRRSLELFRAARDEYGIASALHGVGTIRSQLDDFAGAQQLYAESLAIKRRIGDSLGIAMTLNNLGYLAERRDDDVTARRYYEVSIALKRQLGEYVSAVKSLTNLAGVLIRLGDLAAARTTLAEALGAADAADAYVLVAETVHWTACLLGAAGQAAAAARLFGAAEMLYARYGSRLHVEDYGPTVLQVRAAREQLGAERFAAIWREGTQLDRARIFTLTRELLSRDLGAALDSPQSTPAHRTPAGSLSLAEPLSERELEVLRLLTAGLSNNAIAERLMISVNTVQTHLRNIYGKLGVSSRSAAVSFAYEHGLATGRPGEH